MIHQHRVSPLLMVLLLLTLDNPLLEGFDLQQRTLLAQTASKTQAIRDTVIAHSALQWGKQQAQSAQLPLVYRGQTSQGWRAYLRIFGGGSLLLSNASDEARVWQPSKVRNGQAYFSTHGWSDFCLFRKVSLCQMS